MTVSHVGALPGVVAIVDVDAGDSRGLTWQARTLPANVAVLSVTTRGCVASDKDDRPCPQVALTGAATRAAAYAVEGPVHATLALVHPGWLHAAFGIEADRLTDRRVALGDAWSAAAAASLAHTLHRAPDAGARARCLAAWLARLGAARHEAPSVAAWHERSTRQRLRLFLRHQGLTPVQHAQVERFQHAVAALGRRPAPAHAETALDSGYADQAHMCHAFRRLAGMTPTQLRQRLQTASFSQVYGTLPGFARQLVL